MLRSCLYLVLALISCASVHANKLTEPSSFLGLDQDMMQSVYCAPGCKWTALGDGNCDEACRYEPNCKYDHKDCSINTTSSRYCAPGCLWSEIGNGICNRNCFNAECNNDYGDCHS